MKKIILFISVMNGGGAERVASLLMNEFNTRGYQTEIVITAPSENEAERSGLNNNTRIRHINEKNKKNNLFYLLLRFFTSIFCNIFEILKIPVPAFLAYCSFVSQNYSKISQIKKILSDNPDAVTIGFLQPAIPLLILSARKLPNRVIVSERGNPNMLLKKRYGYNFIKKYYVRANAIVFQTVLAANAYPSNVSKKGRVIANPIKTDLPDAYHGEREKRIVSFCRISPEKRLDILIEAFSLFHKGHPQYTLEIIGDANNEMSIKLLDELKVQVKMLNVSDSVVFSPFSTNVHYDVLKASMYINCSETEGMSNAMLESLALGLPTICTDCPIGGARTIIRDGENGFLVPVNDVSSLLAAMERIADNISLGKKMSNSAVKIRNDLSTSKIADKWIALIEQRD